ncbi:MULTISPECIES: helix-turn-helix domain-containing protein [unclassified Corynebacterium]
MGRAHEKRDKIRVLHNQGLSMRAIAKGVGCSVGTVHRYVHMKDQARA